MDTISIGVMTEQPPNLGKEQSWKQEEQQTPSLGSKSNLKSDAKKANRVISIVPQKRIDLNLQAPITVLASTDHNTTDLRLSDKHSLSVDKLATSTRTPNRYDMDSLKNKTIS